MVQTIVFDMDGTLIDSEAMILEAWKEIATQNGIADIEQTLIKCIGITSKETRAVFCQTYGDDFPYEMYSQMASALYRAEIEKNGLPVKPGVYELFDYLKENHYRIGLASSTREEVVRREMESIGLLDAFEVIVGGDMVTHSKPHPEIYLKSCELLGMAPCDCYAVEDSPNGIRSAYHAGMKVLMVPDLLPPDEEIRRLLFKECKNLLEVRQFLMEKG
ncbi:MAG: HAD family phosphatase [Lachnospiraceae bacterium]|nr:HAD family phosphatase [Lachnospiraceae bacterium]MDE6184545.1 HAD family phosphatase [Lachnospiraceae bacterium]MDE7285597.1 HAD family phosphatase [Lachnospiraceae bacterium]